jgi:hypothetical protein
MGILFSLLGVVVALVVVLFAVAATKPGSFKLFRSIKIASPATDVFQLINNFHEWTKWSPWEKLDPNLQRTYTGPEQGVGAAYAWQGNRNVGQGRMEITESVPNSRIAIDLHFITPFEARNLTEFTLQEGADQQTEVVWAMSGKQPLMMRVMSVFMSLDKMIGKDFESGLRAMKSAAESR